MLTFIRDGMSFLKDPLIMIIKSVDILETCSPLRLTY